MNKKIQWPVCIAIFLIFTSVGARAEGCKIMVLGDQITMGAGPQPSVAYGTTGYRLPLQASLASAGLSCDFVGDRADGFDNNTTDGFTFDPDWQGSEILFADVLAETVGDSMTRLMPNIVLLNIGTYDVLAQIVQNGPGTSLQPPWLAALDVVSVVDTIHATNSTAHIVLTIPGTGNPRNALLEGLRTNLASLMAVRTFASVVDLSLVLRAPDDYVALELPNIFGYEKIANALFPVIEPTIRTLNMPAPVPLPPAFLLLGSSVAGLLLLRRPLL